jgi:hypothetical protein
MFLGMIKIAADLANEPNAEPTLELLQAAAELRQHGRLGQNLAGYVLPVLSYGPAKTLAQTSNPIFGLLPAAAEIGGSLAMAGYNRSVQEKKFFKTHGDTPATRAAWKLSQKVYDRSNKASQILRHLGYLGPLSHAVRPSDATLRDNVRRVLEEHVAGSNG